MADPATDIEKTMSISRADFERSLKILAPDARLDSNGRAEVSVEAGTVTLGFEALPQATLGGLLALPQAKVTLQLTGLDPAHRDDFMTSFDRAFQRGGG